MATEAQTDDGEDDEAWEMVNAARLGKPARFGQASLSDRFTVSTKWRELDGPTAFQAQDTKRCRYDVTPDVCLHLYKIMNGVLQGQVANLRAEGFDDAAAFVETLCYDLEFFKAEFGLTDEEADHLLRVLESQDDVHHRQEE